VWCVGVVVVAFVLGDSTTSVAAIGEQSPTTVTITAWRREPIQRCRCLRGLAGPPWRLE
jgi:hypothetical protein